MQFLDKENRRVILTYKNDKDIANGNHVLAIPFYKQQLLFTQHKVRGIEFPGGKREEGETSMEAIKRELLKKQAPNARNLRTLRNMKYLLRIRHLLSKMYIQLK